MPAQKSRSVAFTIAKQRALVWLLGATWIYIAIVVGIVVVVGAIAAIATSTSSASSGTTDIPPEMMTIYQSDVTKRECPTLSWTILAAIGKIETNHGRNTAVSSAGAQGPMQFMPATWDKPGLLVVDVKKPFGRVPDGQGYGLDGNGNGLADITDPYDAVPAAARYLCANGGGNPKTLPQAIFQYNHSWTYVQDVLSQAKAYELETSGGVASSAAVEEAVSYALSQVGTPYEWGGDEPNGFDCSGLVWWAFHQAGFSFSRTTAAGEWSWGPHVSRSQLQRGDLVFWATSPAAPSTISHVAIYLGDGKIVAAPHSGSFVQVEPMWWQSGGETFIGGVRLS